MWVSALTSGDYQKCRYRLRIADRFSVLGVLCDLYAGENGKEWRSVPEGYKLIGVWKDEFQELPVFVMAWAGLALRDPPIGELRLSELNDMGYGFKTLAKYIEKYL